LRVKSSVSLMVTLMLPQRHVELMPLLYCAVSYELGSPVNFDGSAMVDEWSEAWLRNGGASAHRRKRGVIW
jgi:hypothetical protein